MKDMDGFEWGDGVDKFSVNRSGDTIYLHVSDRDGFPKVRVDLSLEYATKLRDDLIKILKEE